jgi:hypothetical protein
MLCCAVPAAHAVRVPGLYEADVVVADQSNAARAQGIVNALRTVIVKVTGDRAAPDVPDAGLILRAAERYLLQYRYEETEQSGGDGAPPQKVLRLWAQFGQEALDRDLRGAGLAIWGADRPATLAWVAVNDGSGWRWAGADGGDAALPALIEARARARGLGLIFPLHDLDDAGRLSPEAAASVEAAAVAAASERYHADTVLILALEPASPELWRARWTLFAGAETEQWSGEAPLPEALVRDGVEILADHLARRYSAAGAGAEETGIEIQVVAVRSASGYARVLNYLSSLNSVTDVQVSEVSDDMVTFVLTAYGGANAVRQAITLGRVLAPESGPGNRYRLLQ